MLSKIVNQKQPVVDEAIQSCYYDENCATPQILYRLHLETENSPPFACLNDIRLFDVSKLQKGLNFVALNGSTGSIEDSQSFDVARSDEKLITWLRSLPSTSILLGVSFGDIAERVSVDARRALEIYGARKVEKWRGGNAYAILGQRGLKTKAYEMIVPIVTQHSQSIEGCFELPLGDIGEVDIFDEKLDLHRADEAKLAELQGAKVETKQRIKLGEEWPRCGLDEACPADEISMHFYSGESKDDHPRMCIGGRMVFDKELNGAGRGLNLAAIEPKTGRVELVANFDTYEDESTGLEEWLDAVPVGDIVAVVSFDEASTMLSEMAKKIFYEMGSSLIERLKFRASWYFVGRKGIAAYTPFEDLNIPNGNNWAKPIKTSFCLPKSVSKWEGRFDKKSRTSKMMLAKRNLPRRHFCAKYDKHEFFCDSQRIDSLITPRPLLDKKRESDPVFNVPIVVAAGLNSDSLRELLESLLDQEGVNTQMVLVAFDKEYPENAHLASLFHVKSLPINVTAGYNSLLLAAFDAGFSVFPQAPAIAVIEEDIVLSPDWLSFIAETLNPLLEDKSLDLLQLFNPNGYFDTSGNEQKVLRSSYQPPIYSYVLKRQFYELQIRNSSTCCRPRKSGLWKFESAKALVPSLSRIIATPPPKLMGPYWDDALFTKERVASKSHAWPKLNMDFVSEKTYDEMLAGLTRNAKVVQIHQIECQNWPEQFTKLNSLTISVTYGSELEDLSQAAKCFGLFHDKTHIAGTYKKSIRFFANNSTEVLIIPEGDHFKSPLDLQSAKPSQNQKPKMLSKLNKIQ
ncbi:hypothetical protein WR25_05484 [Diploscapter pachys]|uniref:ILEI/PANDER domain-containing protein n=1 Tax=Diploscapter pachys TaxID=2018661 RepID=A0A2A2LWX9_9BILA|nr:hypothetical protein WR25_05484 [Diploscapter pachys]